MTEQTEAPARPLYERLRRIQLDNGWTNKQLADRAGISRGTIDNWKTQPRSPLATTVKDVAERLRIPYPEALALAGIDAANPPPATAAPEPAQRSEDGTVRLTVIVNPEDPEPDYPPGGLRDQTERIIWALIDEPWHVRWAQIQTLRATRTPLDPPTEIRRREHGE